MVVATPGRAASVEGGRRGVSGRKDGRAVARNDVEGRQVGGACRLVVRQEKGRKFVSELHAASIGRAEQ